MTNKTNTKKIQVKKSQLFKQFHESILNRVTGRTTSFKLEVWGHRDELRTRWMDNNAYYPEGSPINLDYRSLSDHEVMEEYNLSRQDAINNQVHIRNEIDSKDEITEKDVIAEIETTNQEVLRNLWRNRTQIIDEKSLKNPRAFEAKDFDQIEIEWIDDTTAWEFLEKNLKFLKEDDE